jgi:hypothetical protein
MYAFRPAMGLRFRKDGAQQVLLEKLTQPFVCCRQKSFSVSVDSRQSMRTE